MKCKLLVLALIASSPAFANQVDDLRENEAYMIAANELGPLAEKLRYKGPVSTPLIQNDAEQPNITVVKPQPVIIPNTKPTPTQMKIGFERGEKFTEYNQDATKAELPVKNRVAMDSGPVTFSLLAGSGVKKLLEKSALEHGYAMNWEGEDLYVRYDANYVDKTYEGLLDQVLSSIKLNGYVTNNATNGKVIYVINN